MNRLQQVLIWGLLQLPVTYSIAQINRPPAPDQIYSELFRDVQMNKIFRDSKTFVDCVPRRDPATILKAYRDKRNNPAIRFSLEKFVQDSFVVPLSAADSFRTARNQDVQTHIRTLWQLLKRSPDKAVSGSSLLPLPHPYMVPGGRFREIYYWDSYFTMLGLQESGEDSLVGNMIENFAYLIRMYGHIPNGNRTYYLSRSQPPFFALMIDLLAQKNGNGIYTHYQKELQQEYDYWMDKTAPTKHVVRMPDGSLLNRFFDQDAVARQESFYEDSLLVKESKQDRRTLYRNLRSGAESGWDFSSRWFADGQRLATIQTTDLVPVDLNGLLYHLEQTLSKSYGLSGNKAKAQQFSNLANKRLKAINKYCWNAKEGWYFDFRLSAKQQSLEKTAAGFSPFFFGVAPKTAIDAATTVLQRDFLKDGGIVTTLKTTGQQWDAPNGWAPLQWIVIDGLEKYGKHDVAAEVARRWASLNLKVYHATGKLMEKYNVVNTTLEAGGGEYPSQDGFGWTNGVLLKIMSRYGVKESKE